MDIFKKIRGLRNLRLCGSTFAWAVVLAVALVSSAGAESCVAPIRPYVPNDPSAVQEFRDLIRQDFEFYIHEVQEYFRCLDGERGRAFDEAREVSQQYQLFLGRDLQ